MRTPCALYFLMNLVITNDDGIDAEGLDVLAAIAEKWGKVTIVAPAEPQSGVGHKLTTQGPIRVEALNDHRFRVWGTPADCTRLALTQIVPDADCLLAGINHGGNLGADIYESGTVAAAREGTLLGCKSVAVSHYIAENRAIDWSLAAERAAPVVAHLLHSPTDDGCFWSVNLPHPPHEESELKSVFCPVDISPADVKFESTDAGYLYTGVYRERPRRPDHDIDTCFNGHIAISRIPLDINPSDT